MKRILGINPPWPAIVSTALLLLSYETALATPTANGAFIALRTFNDCPISTVSSVNNYPASVSITDVMDTLCVGFANLHSWSFSSDGGTNAAVFNNNSNFHFAADFKLDGPGQGEGGLRLSPWYGQYVDGRFMANATTGEIACFGGAIPFYSFTVNHGITYTRGTTIHLEITYRAHGLSSTDPATMQYRVVYNGITYDSPTLPFGEQNPAECDPHGLWGMLNDGRAGGYFQPRANTGAALTATWSNITYEALPPVDTAPPNAAFLALRTFNDCPISTVSSVNNYPSLVSITDVMDTLCVGFANLHSWSFSNDGGTTAEVFNNNSNFHFGADFKLDGAGQGEGGLRLSPWYGQYVDGRFMANATTGEIACFGGAIPFYSFTVNHGITYTRGTTIHLEITYESHDLVSTDPATIKYRVVYNGNTYDSPVLPFGEQNVSECVHGLWGMLDDGRVGGYFQPRANTGAALTATWSNIQFNGCSVPVAFTLMPSVLNRNSKGKWVSAILQPTPPASPSDIDLGSILVNGTVGVAAGAPTSIGDANGDGIPDLSIKLDRSALLASLSGNGALSVTASGLIGSQCFASVTTVNVKANPPLLSPAAGSVLTPGSTAVVRWQPDANPTVDLISTFDGGDSWSIVAQGVPNTGLYRWLVPGTATDNASLELVQIAYLDLSGIVNKAEIAESGTFAISNVTGVPDATPRFGLDGVWPTPSRGSFSVAFSLPNRDRAWLSLYDVAGRRVLSREVGSLGEGSHSLTLGQGENLRTGFYLLRLTQAERSATVRVSVLR
jgi:hypothetical protein